MCVFCDIANHKIPAEIDFEDDEIMAFKTIEPKSPIHILIVPKKHISSTKDLTEEDKGLVGNLVLAARDLAKEKGISESGYRLILNTGRDAGQTVDHIHLHLMGGEKLPFA